MYLEDGTVVAEFGSGLLSAAKDKAISVEGRVKVVKK